MGIKLSYDDAEKAFREVLTQYFPYLPGDVIKAVKAKPVNEIYEICAPDRYKAMFDLTWNRTFKKANAMIFGGRDVPAFTLDVAKVTDRKIYLQDGVIESWGTYYHEAIHYLQHADMYPLFYSMGGDAPFKMEGLTEYCTRYFSTRVAQERETHGNYQKNYLRTKAWIGGDLKREGDLFEVNFKGTGLPPSSSNSQIVNLLLGIVP